MLKPVPYHNDKRDDPTGFKAKARAHQSRFREEQLKVGFTDLYGTKVSLEDGHVGMVNFYPHPWVHDMVKGRYPDQRQTLYCDILRSEHIPFNLFAPLNANKDLLKAALNGFMADTIATVDKVSIEYAPQPRANYLDDATSFDAYIEYTQVKGGKGIIGIEVKYTEGDYKIGTRESQRVANPDSLYWQVSNRSNLYKPSARPSLIMDRFRQVWRNHLLGESMKQKHPETWKEFTLIMLYPAGNIHIDEVAKEYHTLLQAGAKHTFLPMTYKSFIQACKAHSSDDQILQWLEWCDRRYELE